MSKVPVYRWNGQYFGFFYRNRLFDARSTYLGWLLEGDEVRRSDGTFLGELVEGNYNISAGPGVSDALAAGGMMPAGVWL